MIEKICAECIMKFQKECAQKCAQKGDTPIQECLLLRLYLAMARKALAEAGPEGYSVCLKVSEVTFSYFLIKDGIVVAEYFDPRELMGQIYLRQMNPEWF